MRFCVMLETILAYSVLPCIPMNGEEARPVSLQGIRWYTAVRFWPIVALPLLRLTFPLFLEERKRRAGCLWKDGFAL